MNKKTIINLSLVGWVLLSCSSAEEVTSEGDHVSGMPIYHAGEQVGQSEWEVRRLELSPVDYIEQDVIREEILFDGHTFVFEFIFENILEELKVMKYHKDTGNVIAGDSYVVRLEEDRVVRERLTDDGETTSARLEVREPGKVEATDLLFSHINTFIRSHYFRLSRDERMENRTPSLAYDLITHDRL